MKIGVLTGGGDCPGLNGVIRAIYKASISKGWGVIGIENGFQGLLDPPLFHTLNANEIRGILQTGGTFLGTSNISDPFEPSTLRSKPSLVPNPATLIINNIKKLELDSLITIGGDGTLKITEKLYEQGCPVIGIPKTIDNDVLQTDVTVGYRTAVNTVTEALDKLHTTAESHHRVIVVEVMGRYVGWIALEAGIAGEADVILIPEIPFQIEKIVKKVKKRFDEGRKCCVVVTAEGAKPQGGEMSVVKRARSGYILRLGGVGNKIGEEIQRETGKEVRGMVLGHLQRGGGPCSFDRILGTRFGTAAVDLIHQGKFGQMVCLKAQEIESVPIKEAVKNIKFVSPDHDLIRSGETLGISFGR